MSARIVDSEICQARLLSDQTGSTLITSKAANEAGKHAVNARRLMRPNNTERAYYIFIVEAI